MRLTALLLAACLVASLSVACTQTPAKGRDLNAETIEQMGFWGGSPGM